MKKMVDWLVIAAMLAALYINWTSRPEPNPVREVRGPLERLQ